MDEETDVFARMTDEERANAMREMVFGLFGERNGARIWKQMEPALKSRARQLGDDDDPEKNYWKGVWRIYELE